MGFDRIAALKAVEKLDRVSALQTLVRGAIPPAQLQSLMAGALPEDARSALPEEVWAGLASGIAVEDETFAGVLAEMLNDHLAWDDPPGPSLDEWWPLVTDRPLEALWMSALSEAREVRDDFEHLAWHCVENFRGSPEDTPPSWEFVEGVLAVQARTTRALAEAERRAADVERRAKAARQRQDSLRDQLKRLRRENAELRSALARQREEPTQAPTAAGDARGERVEKLERQLRKIEKERAHLARRLERRDDSPAAPAVPDPPREPESPASAGGPPAAAPLLRSDPDPRRRVLCFMLRKLLKKSKIGAAHTHEDNLYRGLPDHQKGLAKQVTALLYREGFLVPKPTASDPHVSLAPDRLADVREIVAGRVRNERLAAFLGQLTDRDRVEERCPESPLRGQG